MLVRASGGSVTDSGGTASTRSRHPAISSSHRPMQRQEHHRCRWWWWWWWIGGGGGGGGVMGMGQSPAVGTFPVVVGQAAQDRAGSPVAGSSGYNSRPSMGCQPSAAAAVVPAGAARHLGAGGSGGGSHSGVRAARAPWGRGIMAESEPRRPGGGGGAADVGGTNPSSSIGGKRWCWTEQRYPRG